MMPFIRLAMVPLLLGGTVAAQDVAPLQLQALHDSAMRRDPRAAQLALLRHQSALRLSNLSAEHLPAASVEALGQYQSDVVRVPVPGGPIPPHDTYDARLALHQPLFDPTARARRAVESAQAAQNEANLMTRLHATRQQVNDAFFSALLAQEQQDELRATITAIEGQLALAANRVREGAALPSEEATVRAELLRRRQLLFDANRARAAALVVLSDLTGMTIDTARRLALPELADAAVHAINDTASKRPEFTAFARSRDVLARQESARGAQELPRVSAFGRVGYGRPGLNPLNDTFDTYWLAGVQLQWAPWTWGTGRRDRELLAVQRRIVDSEEAAFSRGIERSLVRERATIERHVAALALDGDLIALREQIATESRIRYQESAVTAAELIDRQTELLAARITRALHRVELAEARARYLTTLGLEIR